MLQRHSLNFILFSMLLDSVMALGALQLAKELRRTLQIREQLGPDANNILPLPIFPIVLVIWFFSFTMFSIYTPRNNYLIADEMRRIFFAASSLLLVLAGTLYFSFRDVSRLLIIYFYVILLGLLFGWRLGLRSFSYAIQGKSSRKRRVLICGLNSTGEQVADAIRAHAWAGLELIGFVDSQPDPSVQYSVLGTLADVLEIVKHRQVDEVVIALPGNAHDSLSQIVADLQTISLQVRVVPDYYNLTLHRAKTEDFGGFPLISLREPALSPDQRLIKRAFDLVVGFISLVAVAPFMLVVAVVIKLTSEGPVIFKQTRIGENGALFTMYKFRTMVNNAAHIRTASSPKSPDDPRVTWVGKWLRRTSLDELPQLWNILNGTMSLVGPRPEIPSMVERYESWQRKRFAVPQGLTGWWQINGRSDRPMHLHTEDDLYYIQNYSIWFDIWILLWTVPVVISRKGAY